MEDESRPSEQPEKTESSEQKQEPQVQVVQRPSSSESKRSGHSFGKLFAVVFVAALIGSYGGITLAGMPITGNIFAAGETDTGDADTGDSGDNGDTGNSDTGETPQPSENAPSFTNTGEEICTEDGKPIIRLFSTTWCPHCSWIIDTYDSVVKEYVDAGKIVAYHWEIDIGDDTLTEEVETEVPAEELAIYRAANERGSIPTYVFGCKYARIGNGYERQGDDGLILEDAEFRALIDELVG